MLKIIRKGVLAGVLVMAASTGAEAASCGNTGAGFDKWKKQISAEARSAGISQRTINAALKGVSYDRRVIRLDRNQRAFKQSFKQFSAKRVTKGRINRGRALLRRHAKLLSRIEKRYGVPGPVVVAIWGLETDFGANTGNLSVMRSLATLAYDCRRSKFFTNELMNALRIVQRGDMRVSQMRGAWAGELGQTQFLASSYMRFAVDFDGNGRRDLVRSVPDVLASTANYLRGYGWRAGAGWQPGSANYSVLGKWNKSSVYRRTIALFATRLAG